MKYTANDMKKIAASHGGKFLSKKYVNTVHKLDWQCSKGHTWKANLKALNDGVWCLKCKENKHAESSLAAIKKIAKKKEGECLSLKYVNAKTPLKFRCKRGHEWKTTPAHITNNDTWCRKCSKITHSIGEMKSFAAKKGGKCLSSEYLTTNDKLLWQCDQRHTWRATPMKILTGRWCPHYTCRTERTHRTLALNRKKKKRSK